MLEPLRAPVCDLLVLNIFNHSILKNHDFKKETDGGYFLKENARKKFFIHYDRHMERNFSLAHLDKKINFRQCIKQQVWDLLKFLESPSTYDINLFHMP